METRRRDERKRSLVVLVRRLPPVADNVHSSEDFTHGEETQNLSSGDTDEGEFLGGSVTDAGQDLLLREGTLGGVAGEGEEVLVVRLEGGHVAIQWLAGFSCCHALSRSGLESGRSSNSKASLREEERESHGGVMPWPRKTSLPSSNPTFE